MTRRNGRLGRKFNRARMVPARAPKPQPAPGGTPTPAPPWAAMCETIWQERPLTFPKNPYPYRKFKQSSAGQKLSSWLTNVIYWRVKPDSYPVKIGPGHKKAANLWVMINKCVKKNAPNSSM